MPALTQTGTPKTQLIAHDKEVYDIAFARCGVEEIRLVRACNPNASLALTLTLGLRHRLRKV